MTLLLTGLILYSIVQSHELNAASFITHGEVGQRALCAFDGTRYPEYKAFMENHPDAFQGGAAFPDWGYGFGNDDESEAAHWDPFIQAAANHFHENYGPPFDKEEQKYIAFLLGVMAHSQSDISWHALSGFEEGFVEAMAQTNYNGVWGDAHGEEVGGDIVCDYEFDTSWLASSWYTPIDDVVEVYHKLGYTNVSAFVLTLQTGKLYLAAKLGLQNSSFLFGQYSSKSPFLIEQLQDYFSGGLDEMAIQSAWRFEEVIDWMENGAAEKKAPSFFNPEQKLSRTDFESLREFFSEGAGIKLTRTERGVVFCVDESSSNRIPEPTPSPLAASSPFIDSDPFFSTTLAITNDLPYSYLGKSLTHADFNKDGLDDLVMGAPGYSEEGHPQIGAVYVCFGRTHLDGHSRIVLRDDETGLALFGNEDFSRFGFAVTALDFNADGLIDLAISAPTAGARDIAYRGKVMIYPGIPDGQGLSTVPSWTFETKDKHTNMGISLDHGDIDGDGYDDLLIGSPFARAGGVQRGRVAVFYSDDANEPGTLSLQDADWIANGENDYDWFGYEVSASRRLTSKTMLFVGAPGYGSDAGSQDLGRVYGYSSEDIAADPLDTAPVFTVTGTDEFDKTGQFFAAGSPLPSGPEILAISSPTRTNRATLFDTKQAGDVRFFEIEDLRGHILLDSSNQFSALVGTDSFGRFGWRVGFADLNGDGVEDLWSTSPYRKTNAGVEAGSAYLWYGKTGFGSEASPSAATSASERLDYKTKRSFFGSALAFPDLNGDGCADTAFGASRSSRQNRLEGEVVVVIAPESENCIPAGGNPDEDSDTHFDTGSEAASYDTDTTSKADTDSQTDANQALDSEHSRPSDDPDASDDSTRTADQDTESAVTASGNSTAGCGCAAAGPRKAKLISLFRFLIETS